MTSPDTGNQSAIDFASALIKLNHSIYRVFFYSDGARNAIKGSQAAKQWQALNKGQTLDLVVCVTAAKKHGLLPNQGDNHILADTFTVSGLGQLADAAAHCDRIITFR